MLIQKLSEHQRRLRETDARFAHRLGVSVRLWRLARTENHVYPLILQGTARNFPDLHEDILLFLIEGGNTFPDDGNDTTDDGAPATEGEREGVTA